MVGNCTLYVIEKLPYVWRTIEYVREARNLCRGGLGLADCIQLQSGFTGLDGGHLNARHQKQRHRKDG
jgi:hypothetical protein